jgi:hypothetical protein
VKDEPEMAFDLKLESEVVTLTRSEGKIVAIQRYRQATGTSVKRAHRAVEEILFRHGVFSMNRPRFRSCGGHLLVAASGCVGLLVVLLLVILFENQIAGLYVGGSILLLSGAIGFTKRSPPISPGIERLTRFLCVALGVVVILVGVWISTPAERERLVWVASGIGTGVLVAWFAVRRLWA